MTMLRTLSLTGLFSTLLMATPAPAQMAELDKLATTTPEQRADFLTQAMTSELTLSSDQVPKVRALNLQYAELQQPLLEQKGSLFSRVRQISKLNSQKESKLKPLLSAEQWAKYEKSRPALKQQLETWADSQTAKPKP